MFTTSTWTTALGVSKGTVQDTCSLTIQQKVGSDMTLKNLDAGPFKVGDRVTVTRNTTETFTRNNA